MKRFQSSQRTVLMITTTEMNVIVSGLGSKKNMQRMRSRYDRTQHPDCTYGYTFPHSNCIIRASIPIMCTVYPSASLQLDGLRRHGEHTVRERMTSSSAILSQTELTMIGSPNGASRSSASKTSFNSSFQPFVLEAPLIEHYYSHIRAVVVDNRRKSERAFPQHIAVHFLFSYSAHCPSKQFTNQLLLTVLYPRSTILTTDPPEPSHKPSALIVTMATETQTHPPPPPAKETFHFINDPSDAINEALIGLTHLKPNLSYNKEYKIIYRNDLCSFSKSHVTTIGFAGGGHEPMFGGFVGPNYLSAYVSGNIFASPTAAQIFEAIKMCQPPEGPEGRGTLIVCGNYTGDILNAGLAITRAQAAGYRVYFKAVGDDVAVGRKKGGKVGRRGLSGHLVALKSACALAERGEGLGRVSEVMEYVAGNVGTIGVAFDRVALPNATLTDLQSLPPATIELGMGAHGEPGLQQISPIPSADALVSQMLDLLLDISDSDRAFIPFSQATNPISDNEIVLLLNSLGSTSDEVLARFAEIAKQELEKQGFVVRRLTLGPLVTSLKMSGFGITVWRLPPDSDEVMDRKLALDLWDSKVDVYAWRQ
ncbi:Dihydroxyacetone kinase 1 [Fulvia fulva]|nr:Dihydroxyacetone kinase 1 [Fulvia fulva]WPV12945.1 Dihydroxyacetone kinase 1 [Fulvia fulva]WPV27817.1 Dihydroxyacetone kinase 1 [Fulvia fulva]